MSTSFLPFSTGGCFDHDIFPTTLHAKLRTLLTRVAVLVQASILNSQKTKAFYPTYRLNWLHMAETKVEQSRQKVN